MYPYNIEFIRAENEYRRQLVSELLGHHDGERFGARVRRLLGRRDAEPRTRLTCDAESLRHAW